MTVAAPALGKTSKVMSRVLPAESSLTPVTPPESPLTETLERSSAYSAGRTFVRFTSKASASSPALRAATSIVYVTRSPASPEVALREEARVIRGSWTRTRA